MTYRTVASFPQASGGGVEAGIILAYNKSSTDNALSNDRSWRKVGSFTGHVYSATYDISGNPLDTPADGQRRFNLYERVQS